jgi:tetratricopeptide (TPR) repeat protein
MAAGPGVAAGVFEGGQLLDVAPTVLAAFGFGATGLGGRPFAYAAEPRLLAQAPEPPPRSRVEADQELLAVAAADGHPPPPAAAPAWEAQWLAELAYFLLSSSPEAALETADKALARHADLVIALGTKAYACLALERSEPLPALAAALCQAAPTRGWGALTHAAHAVLVGDPRAATPWLQQAERDPDREIQIRTGAVWMAAGRPDQAARLFDALLALDPHDVSAGVGAAMAAMTRRDFRTAEDLLRRAARHDPGAHVVRLQLAIVYARTGRRLEAMAEAERAVSLGAPPDLAAAALEGGKGPG